MTTVMTNSRPSSSRNQFPVPAPSSLPFPTTPALPDRRARAKGANLTLASGESFRSRSRLQIRKSQRAKRDEGEGRESEGELQLIEKTGELESQDRLVTISADSSKVRRSHRNIVTSKRKAEETCSSSLVSHSSLTFNSTKSGSRRTAHEEDKKHFMPATSCRVADPPPLPQGVFLTSLLFEDSPDPEEQTPLPGSTREKKGTSTDAPTGHDCDNHSPQGHLPVLVTPRDNASSSRVLATRNTFGLQRVYLEGLDYMKTHVLSVEKGAETINRRFHRAVEAVTVEDWLRHMKECNQGLLQANAHLLRSGVTLEVIDSETKLVTLLNNLRADVEPDQSLVEFLTAFWHDLKTATQDLQVLLEKFNWTVVHRITHNYTSSHISQLQVSFCREYATNIEDFHKDLNLQLTNASLLLGSYRNVMSKDITETSLFAQRLMVSCDLKAFPILGFVSDICEKITQMCQTARRWLARDEQFMQEVDEFIRETRAVTRNRERALHTEKMRQKKVEKNVKVAHSILRSNREKLNQIEVDLQELEHKLNKSKEEQKARLGEIHQKESMMDFLKLTLQQTRKNCRLQNKRTKLLKQVKELEDYLKLMEMDLEVVQDQILVKSHERILLTEKINKSEKSYGVVKSDLDVMCENLEELEAEVSGLSGQLLQLEIVHTIRTSPEILDNLTDRPTSVKLSQSLKNRIKHRLRASVTTSS